jgi:hypothetical protein
MCSITKSMQTTLKEGKIHARSETSYMNSLETFLFASELRSKSGDSRNIQGVLERGVLILVIQAYNPMLSNLGVQFLSML